MNTNLFKILVFSTILCLFNTHSTVFEQNQLVQFFEGCRKQLEQWVGFDQNTTQLITKCNLQKTQQKIFQLYDEWVHIDLSFNHKHFDILRKYLKEYPQFQQSFTCLINARNTENEFFNEKRKFKYFGKFIKEHPNQGKNLLVQIQKLWLQKGKKLCNYFKAFFQYYYLNVFRPSQTLSTTFLRALTVRTLIFNHEDIAYCVDLETHGKLAQNLDQLDINNIYVKIPEVFNAIKYLKLKRDCRSEKNINMVKKIQQKLKNIDMFKIMYHDYEPFVEVAAQKFGTSQLKLLARKIAHIIQNPNKYEKYSTQQL